MVFGESKAKIIKTKIENGTIELKPEFAMNMIVGFGRLNGYSVGIIGAEITAAGDAGTFTATTDNTGRWQIPDVPQGTYTITIRAPNHEDLVLSDVNVAGTAVDLGTNEMMFSGAAPTGGVWDINNNGKLDLADIIYGLQVLSNMRAQE